MGNKSFKLILYRKVSCRGCFAFKNSNCEFGYKNPKRMKERMNGICSTPICRCPNPTSIKEYQKIIEVEEQLLKNYWLVDIRK